MSHSLPPAERRAALTSQLAALSRQLGEVGAQLQRVTRELAELDRLDLGAVPPPPEAAPAPTPAATPAPAAEAAPADPASSTPEGDGAGATAAPIGLSLRRGPTAEAEVLDVLRAAFALALSTNAADPQALQDSLTPFRELVHSSRQGTPLLNSELLAYKWRPWVQRARQYLQPSAAPDSFVITQWAPAELTADTQQVKVFLRADKRMPTPVTLRRDPEADNAFRIEATSL